MNSVLAAWTRAEIAAADGLWVPGPAQTLRFAELPPPTDEDVAALTHKIARRLTKVARRLTKVALRCLAAHEDEWHDPDDEQAARRSDNVVSAVASAQTCRRAAGSRAA
ncbi:MAG: hypothetical protein ABI333_16265 [bacterium]